MKLYLFEVLSTPPKFTKKEFEVEKNKEGDYLCIENRILFRKENIGIPYGPNHNSCLLLENNPTLAASIILVEKEEELRKQQVIVDVLKKGLIA